MKIIEEMDENKAKGCVGTEMNNLTLSVHSVTTLFSVSY